MSADPLRDGVSDGGVSDDDVTAVMSAVRALVGIAVLSLGELDERISLTQFRALAVLDEAGTLKASDLARELGVSGSAVTRLCDRLVKDRLLRRAPNPHSRREVLLSLTATGGRLVKRVLDRRRHDLAHVLSLLSPRERAAVAASLGRFADASAVVHGQQMRSEWSVG